MCGGCCYHSHLTCRPPPPALPTLDLAAARNELSPDIVPVPELDAAAIARKGRSLVVHTPPKGRRLQDSRNARVPYF